MEIIRRRHSFVFSTDGEGAHSIYSNYSGVVRSIRPISIQVEISEIPGREPITFVTLSGVYVRKDGSDGSTTEQRLLQESDAFPEGRAPEYVTEAIRQARSEAGV